jgi:hypothetical protein
MAELHRQAAGNHGNLESVFLELTREQERESMAARESL